MCRPSANTENSRRTREKTLVSRVWLRVLGKHEATEARVKGTKKRWSNTYGPELHVRKVKGKVGQGKSCRMITNNCDST